MARTVPVCSIAAGEGARLEGSSGTEAMAMTGQCGDWETVLELMGSYGWGQPPAQPVQMVPVPTSCGPVALAGQMRKSL